MLITIDDFYNIETYNEHKEALLNNGVEFKEYISSKAPYHYYLEVPEKPMFINYDPVPEGYSKYLVSIIKALKPNDDYIYRRKEAHTGLNGLKFYTINDALRSGEISKEGVFFTADKAQAIKISKDYPRKIYFMGRYFGRKYKIYFTDNLLVKNYIKEENILVHGKDFGSVISLETELNYKIFKGKDKLEKLSETPYILDGKYHPLKSIRPDLSDKYTI